MGDKPDPQNSAASFLAKLNTRVLGYIAVVSAVAGFVAKLSGKDDTSIWIFSALGVCAVCLWLICLHYAFLQKPETPDQGTSLLVLPPSEPQVKSQRKKEWGRKRNRFLAITGLVAIPLLTFGGLGYWHQLQNQPSKDILILVADFKSAIDQDYFVTTTIFEKLETAINPYPDVKVERLNRIIQGKTEAENEGKKQKASIVIWGSYGKTKEVVNVSVNFEVLRKPDYFPELAPEAKGEVRTAAVADLESSTLQINLSKEMSYLTLFTLGLSRFTSKDWDGAIARFSNALERVKEPVPSLSLSNVYLYRGTSHIAKRSYDQAIADYEKVVQLEPKDSWAYNNLGFVYIFEKEYDKAIEKFDQSLQINNWGGNPGSSSAYNNRGLAYCQKRNCEQAIQDFNTAIRLKPDSSLAYNNLAAIYSAQKNWDLAIQNSSKAIQINHDWGTLSLAQAYSNRCSIYIEKEDYEQAISDCEQAIKLDPNSALAFANLGIIYTDKRMYEQAVENHNKAIQIKPEFAEAYNNRGNTYLEFFGTPQAISDYEKAIQLQPKFALAYFNLGRAFLSKTDYEQAIKSFDKAISLRPTNGTDYLYRGEAFLRKGDIDQAITDYNTALSLYIKLQSDVVDIYEAYKSLSNAYLEKGNSYAKKKQYDLAIVFFTLALNNNPSYSLAYYNRGRAYFHKKEYGHAVKDFSNAIEINKGWGTISISDAYASRSVAHYYQGNYDFSIVDSDKAIELFPSSSLMYLNRGAAYNAKNQYDKAILDYSAAIQINSNWGELHISNAYAERGFIYLNKNNSQDAVKDFKKVIEIARDSSLKKRVNQELRKLGVTS